MDMQNIFILKEDGNKCGLTESCSVHAVGRDIFHSRR